MKGENVMKKQVAIPENAIKAFHDLRWLKGVLELGLDNEEVSEVVLAILAKVAEEISEQFWKLVLCNSPLHGGMKLSLNFEEEIIEAEDKEQDNTKLISLKRKEKLH